MLPGALPLSLPHVLQYACALKMTLAIDPRCYPDPCPGACVRTNLLEAELSRVRGVVMAYALDTLISELRERVVAAECRADAAEFYARRWKRLAKRLCLRGAT